MEVVNANQSAIAAENMAQEAIEKGKTDFTTLPQSLEMLARSKLAQSMLEQAKTHQRDAETSNAHADRVLKDALNNVRNLQAIYHLQVQRSVDQEKDVEEQKKITKKQKKFAKKRKHDVALDIQQLRGLIMAQWCSFGQKKCGKYGKKMLVSETPLSFGDIKRCALQCNVTRVFRRQSSHFPYHKYQLGSPKDTIVDTTKPVYMYITVIDMPMSYHDRPTSRMVYAFVRNTQSVENGGDDDSETESD
jgi:hypothetical protein